MIFWSFEMDFENKKTKFENHASKVIFNYFTFAYCSEDVHKAYHMKKKLTLQFQVAPGIFYSSVQWNKTVNF